jgi:hypothetical protein
LLGSGSSTFDSSAERERHPVDVTEVLDLLDKHGDHALLLAMVVMLYLMGKEFRNHRKELKAQRGELERHRDDEIVNRSELIRYGIAMQEIGTAVKILLERDRDRHIDERIKEVSGVHDVDPRIAAMADRDVRDQNGTSEEDGDVTPLEVPPPPKRHRTPPHGSYSVSKRPGTKGGS